MKIKKLDFGEVYISLGLQYIHRMFSGEKSGIIALYGAMEILHNLNGLIEELKFEKNGKLFKEWYKSRIEKLKKGIVPIRKELFNKVMDGIEDLNMREKIEKEAARQILIYFKEKGILKFMKTGFLPE